MIKYIFGAIVIALIIFFKPITIYFAQIYTSSLLEQNVKITSFTLSSLTAQGYIENSNNKVTADVKSIIPLKVLATYSGDIDAFKTYHPLKGYAEATAGIYYDESLLITGQASLYGADANVTVKEMKENWFVGVDATSLNLKTLQEQNGQEVKAEAKIDLALKLYTDANTSVNLQTKTINISSNTVKDVDINLFQEKENFKLITSFIPPNFYKTSLDANGTFKDGNISSYMDIGFKDENIIINDLNFNTKTLHTTIHTSSLGGELDATYKDETLFLDAKNLHLSKVLKIAQQEIKARGYINIKSKLDTKNLTSTLSFYSPGISTPTQKLGSLKIMVPHLAYKDDVVNTSTNIMYEDLVVDIDNIHINTKTLQTSLHTSSFGGDLDLDFKDGLLNYNANSLHLSKIFAFAKQKQHARGYINIDGELNTKTLETNFIIKSPKLFTKTQNIKNVKLSVPKLSYKNKKLDATYTFKSKILNKNLSFYGDVNYTDHIVFNLNNKDFSGKNKFNLKNKNFTFSFEHLDIKELLKFSSNKPLASGKLSIKGNGDFNKIDFKIASNVIANKKTINLKSNSSYKINTNSIESLVNLQVPLKNENLVVDANIKYENHLIVDANSSSFGSSTVLKIDKENFKFSIYDMDLQKLSKALEYKKTFFGHLDVNANGTLKDIDFNIKSHYIKQNMLLGKIDNSLGLNISGNYTPELLTLRDGFTLNYEKESTPIKMNASIQLKAPYNSKGSFLQAKDKFIINSFSYQDKQIKSNFLIDINDLYKYRSITSVKLYGGVKIKGTDDAGVLKISTNSFGGEAQLKLKKKVADIKFKNISIDKVATLFDKTKLIENGLINADASYDIKDKKAKSDISINDTLIKNIDLDNTLSTLNDALGLNIIGLSRSYISSYKDSNQSQTDIQQLQFNVSLKDKNINLDDVALKTKKFRIVALGDIQENGDINKLNVNIVDKHGCSIITQGLSGNIKDPKTAKTTTTLVSIAGSIPSSVLGTGRKILDFASRSVDDVATFGTQTILRSDSEVSLTSDIVSKSTSLMSHTSNIILPFDCKVIYDGKVKHPINNKE